MNKRIILTWISILTPIQLIVICFINGLINNDTIRLILIDTTLLMFFIEVCSYSAIICYVGSPKNEMPYELNLLYYPDVIECIQIKGGIYQVNIYNKKLILDMSGWIFKRQYIRDIVLMYLHLKYYNFHKFALRKIRSKKYFPGKTISINFKLLNGTTKKLFLINNGVEQRSIVCSMKLLFISEPIKRYNNIDNRDYDPYNVINIFE